MEWGDSFVITRKLKEWAYYKIGRRGIFLGMKNTDDGMCVVVYEGLITTATIPFEVIAKFGGEQDCEI